MSTESSDDLTPETDNPDIFHDEAFRSKYPDLKMPPPSFVASGASIRSFESGSSIEVDFPVRDYQANPIGTLQGGILCSFFDDAFGTLAFASLRRPCITIDVNVNFVRTVKLGETVCIRAEFKSRTRKILHLYAEARNSKNKLVATATSNLMVLELKQGSGNID